MVSRLRHTSRGKPAQFAQFAQFARVARVALAVFGAVRIISPGVVAGCFTNVCDGDYQSYSGGQLLENSAWQSSPVSGAWLAFPARRTWHIDTSALGRMPSEVLLWVSSVPNPSTGTGGFTVASGNLALVKNVSPNSLDIVNDTCAEMYLRIVVRADGPQVIGAVAAPDSGPRDGGL